MGAAFVAVGCGVVVAVYGGFIMNALSHAAGDNGCFRMERSIFGYYAFYDDHSGYCHNY